MQTKKFYITKNKLSSINSIFIEKVILNSKKSGILCDNETKQKINEITKKIQILEEKIQNKNRYLSVHNPVSDNIYSLPVVRLVRKTKKSKLYNTYLLIDDHTTGNYLLYYNIDINKDSLHLISRIDKSYFKLFPMIYNYDKLNKISNKITLSIKKSNHRIEFEMECRCHRTPLFLS